nr:aminopeptidase [uncultured Pseudoxanthomonas sp.]
MTRLTVSILGAAIACVVLTACQKQETPPPADTQATAESAADSPAEPAAPPVDLEQLAQRLVASAAVKEGDAVIIVGRTHDAELLEDIALQVRRAGAFPMIEYTSDRLAKRMFFDVPAQFDSQAPALDLALSKVFDVVISLSNGTSENLFEGADPQRVAARGKAGEAIGQAFMKENVRQVEIGNGLYPTPWRAQRLGMSETELARTFWEGVNVDHAALQTRGQAVKGALAAGNELHISHPNGTDYRMRIQGRPVLVSDGVISPEDIRSGGPALQVFLPAGEVYTTPVAGTGEGRIVATRDYFRGQAIDDLAVTVAGGKITALTGTGPGFAALKAEFDAVGDARKNEVSFFDMGINPNVKLPSGSQVGNWVPAGTVTLGLGNNLWAGGDNAITYGMNFFLPGSTVTLDGKVIVDKGQLTL